jgi:hypothetical protein
VLAQAQAEVKKLVLFSNLRLRRRYSVCQTTKKTLEKALLSPMTLKKCTVLLKKRGGKSKGKVKRKKKRRRRKSSKSK